MPPFLTVFQTVNGKGLVLGTHIGLASPCPAPIIIYGVKIVISGNEIAFQQCFAGLRSDIPPSFRRPALVIAVANGDANAAGGGIAKLEIGVDLCWCGERQAENCKEQ